jgi:hypothetical protein
VREREREREKESSRLNASRAKESEWRMTVKMSDFEKAKGQKMTLEDKYNNCGSQAEDSEYADERGESEKGEEGPEGRNKEDGSMGVIEQRKSNCE